MVSTVAGNSERGDRDGLLDEAMFDSPCGLVVDEEGNVFVCDLENKKIKKISKGVVTTFKCDMIDYPRGMASTMRKTVIVCGTQIVRMNTQGMFETLTNRNTSMTHRWMLS